MINMGQRFKEIRSFAEYRDSSVVQAHHAPSFPLSALTREANSPIFAVPQPVASAR